MIIAKTHAYALGLMVVSLSGWWTWLAWRPPPHPTATLTPGGFTDHFSHVSGTRLAWREGSGAWRRSILENTQPLTAEQIQSLPEDLRISGTYDIRRIKNRPDLKPIASSWSQFVQHYPPGYLLVFALPAWVYENTSITFTNSNRWTIALLLLLTHVSLCLMLIGALRDASSIGLLGWLAVFFVYQASIHWTLEGFYDPVYWGPLLVCGWLLRQRRPLGALVAYCLAAFLHYRAYYYGPLALASAWQIIEAKSWRTWRRREWLLLVLAAIMAVSSLWSFALCWHSVVATPPRNAVWLGNSSYGWAAAFVVVSIAAVGWLLRNGSRWEAASVLWLSFMFLTTPATRRWYGLVTAPLLLLGPGPNDRHPRASRFAQLTYSAFVIFVACGERLGLDWMAWLFWA